MAQTTYSIFVASSMKENLRGQIRAAIKEVNNTLKEEGIDIVLEATIYGEEPIKDAEQDTQVKIDGIAVGSDLFILIASNGTQIGEYTFNEYVMAHSQSQKIKNKPLIKAFIITENDDDKANISVPYVVNGTRYDNFEDRLYEDSKRYTQIVNRDNFIDFFKKWLKINTPNGLDNNYSQDELSYKAHIDKNGQGLIRKSDNPYYRRENLDGKIDEILEWSPIIILEGSPYSGKTRAAYHVMERFTEWRDYSFHLFNNLHNTANLNNIRLDLRDQSEGNIYFIDDINDIIKTNIESIDYTVKDSLWGVLNGLKDGKDFTKEDFGNTRIIITVSGTMQAERKKALYKAMFGTEGDKLDKYINRITVNFDIYDRRSFLNMIFLMRKDGALPKDGVLGHEIQQGNYTIGSLFINKKDITSQVTSLYNDIPNGENRTKATILKTIVGNYKYSKDTRFFLNLDELRSLYRFYEGDTKNFYTDIEVLRAKGLIIKSNDRIDIDRYIIETCHEVVTSALKRDKLSGDMVLNHSLAEYAKKQSSDNIPSVAKMCFLLCDRNNLPDDEILDLIDLAIYTILDLKKDKINDKPRIQYLVKISEIDNNYHTVFCETAIASISDFNKANNYINIFKEYIEKLDEKNKDSSAAIKLYKRVVYAMFSKSNRTLMMGEEKIILDYIFNEDMSWKAPFTEEDLNDIFNISRISPFLSQKTLDVDKEINFIANSKLDDYDMTSVTNTEDEFDEEEEQGDVDIDGLYTKVFIPRVGEALITALCKVDSYDELRDILDKIKNDIYSKDYLKDSVRGNFFWRLLRAIRTIAKRLSYEDRKRLFDFVFELDVTRTIIGKEEIDTEYNLNPVRIGALNQLLILLDEFDALQAYKKMIDSDRHDFSTLSHLFKNKFLTFEQLLPLVNDKDEQTNFITLNQLMSKAETLSDANTCLRLMNIQDADPSKLRDETALSCYLKIRSIGASTCFDILRKWHNVDENRILSDMALVPVFDKLSIDDIFDILDPNGKNIDYMAKYGLNKAEIDSVRVNAVFYNKLFYRANRDTNYIKRLDELYNRLVDNVELRPIVMDYNLNAHNGILSVYIKNRDIFPDYDSTKKFIDAINDTSFRKDNNIYEPMIWWAKENKDLNLLNEILKDAYTYFANHFTRDEVVRMMAELYHYVPSFISNFDNEVEIAYEDKVTVWNNFKEYVNHLMVNNIAYIDGTFIYRTFEQMKCIVHNDIYNLMAEVARLNRKGVDFLTIERLPNPVSHKLFWIDRGNGTITIDTNILFNIPKIKMFWYTIQRHLLTVDQVETYRENNGIALTQTYVNMVFRAIEQEKFNKFNDHRFEKMIAFLNKIDSLNDPSTPSLHRSIQMCISLILTARTEAELDEIFTTYGFDNLRYRTEAIGARMHKLINKRYVQQQKTYDRTSETNTIEEFKADILNNPEQINITVVNAYIYALLLIKQGNLLDVTTDSAKATKILNNCWGDIYNQRKIDIYKLLDIFRETETWMMDIDVQTVTYFAEQCDRKRLISTIIDWFDGNFCYDESGKKSCLKDAIKNYSSVYTKANQDLEEVAVIVDILLKEENISDCKSLCLNYILNNRRGYKQYNPFSLWRDIAENNRFKDYLTQYFRKSNS
ncbi:MAG: hypothetical protein IKY74_05845 [Alistipes sp.]|nr:hypothetical protein [Alistipes sp.]